MHYISSKLYSDANCANQYEAKASEQNGRKVHQQLTTTAHTKTNGNLTGYVIVRWLINTSYTIAAL